VTHGRSCCGSASWLCELYSCDASTVEWREPAVTYRKPLNLDFACMQEALEVGATTLLLDEDTCASNFMHRDARMRVHFVVVTVALCSVVYFAGDCSTATGLVQM
jgi:hypothetical protein